MVGHESSPELEVRRELGVKRPVNSLCDPLYLHLDATSAVTSCPSQRPANIAQIARPSKGSIMIHEKVVRHDCSKVRRLILVVNKSTPSQIPVGSDPSVHSI